MKIDEITPEWLENTIQALVRGEAPPDDALTLHLLDATGSPAERTLALHDYLLSLVVERLSRLRRAEGLPHDDQLPHARGATAAALGRDFGCGNLELEAWSAFYHRYLCPVSLSVKELAAAAHVVPRHFRRRVNRAMWLLIRQMQAAENEAHGQLRRVHLGRHLPPPDFLALFGIAPLIQQLGDLLTAAGPSMLAIDGLGGIGKTTLAQAVADHLTASNTFADILWVSARQEPGFLEEGAIQVERKTSPSRPALTFEELLSRLAGQIGREDLIACRPEERQAALQEVFQTRPHLIVVDNLETMTDYRAIAPRLQPMAGPSRFLITSRHSLREYPFIYTLSVPPLSRVESLALLRYELERRGREGDISAQALDDIFDAVGGLPLALKLIAAQLGRLPLSHILDNLRAAHSATTEALYTFIYRHTWMLLDESSRQLLMNMLLVSPEGENIEWLGLISALPQDRLARALRQLQEFSLLQVTGSLEHPFYRLHRLTVTFLETEMLARWAEQDVV
ncbi:MAG: NB-ARC domain-containing protein [Anaerolineales bacterium]